MEMIAIFLLALTLTTSVLAATPPSTQLRQYVFHDAVMPAKPFCPLEVAQLRNAIYLLYDVNPPEGFNLRRDVYVRLAVFVHKLKRQPAYKNVRLVLPPWPRLYHWRSQHLQQADLPWSSFFDIESMRRYAPVLDYREFLDEMSLFGLPTAPRVPLHKAYQLQHFEEMFTSGQFYDKYEFQPECAPPQPERYGNLIQQPTLQLINGTVECVHFQGGVSLLAQLLGSVLQRYFAANDQGPKVIALLNAETVLHDHWGDREYWRARRSMRFAAPLVTLAAQFRQRHFNDSDVDARVQRPPMWEMERSYRGAKGGEYLCAHWRRGDFVYGREQTTPSLRSTALQIKLQMRALNLTTVFLATDANAFELQNLRSHLKRVHLVRFSAESLQQKAAIKDGGIAIVDQLICAHARYFIGTYESTFTYRIYEEREILGFSKASTFNTFCKNVELENCPRNSVWPIVY